MDWYEQVAANGDQEQQDIDCKNHCLNYNFCNNKGFHTSCTFSGKFKRKYHLCENDLNYVIKNIYDIVSNKFSDKNKNFIRIKDEIFSNFEIKG